MDEATRPAQPLAGVRVVEFTHMVMGPAAGLVLADLGAEVVRVEPLGGDPTRRLVGSGAGYFPMYNRNKASVCLDLKSADGLGAAVALAAAADVVIENFRPGALERLGLGYAALGARNPGLIYCSAKGFLPGPYEHRAALDEVAQMMGGLAYMTGPPGRPLRAGASVIDVAGGMFGALAVLAALHERTRTGRGQEVRCSLFETTAFLVGQHMAQKAVTGVAARPMPVRTSAWAIYDVFETRDEAQVFVGVVSDGQWRAFCREFGLDALAADPALATNSGRVEAREALLPLVRDQFAGLDAAALLPRLETAGLPFAPVAKPEDLFDDPHLNAAGGLLDVAAPGVEPTRLPALPVAMGGARPGLRLQPQPAGAQSREALAAAGLSAERIAALFAAGAAA